MGQERGALSLLFFCGQSTAFFSLFPISRRKAGCFLCSVFAWGLGECGVFCNYLLSFSIDWFNEKGKKKGCSGKLTHNGIDFFLFFCFFRSDFLEEITKATKKKRERLNKNNLILLLLLLLLLLSLYLCILFLSRSEILTSDSHCYYVYI